MASMVQRQRAPLVDGKPEEPRKSAVYCGDGLFLRSLSKQPDGRVSFGRDTARAYTRAAAVAALHIVRKAGRSAWLVPHPGKVAKWCRCGLMAPCQDCGRSLIDCGPGGEFAL